MNKKKVCLINPPWITKKNNFWSQIKSTMPPLGLLYLAAFIEKEGIEVDVFDSEAEQMSWEEIENKIKSNRYDFYGITAVTPTITKAYKISKVIKKYYPDTKIVIGGVHATALPHEALKEEAIDFVIRGEGEEAFLKLLQDYPYEKISGLSYKQNGSIKHFGPNAIIQDLDKLPFPAFHKINLKLYKPAFGANKRLPAINMLTTRGCPGRCTFCNSANIPLRKRSAENIFSEMHMLSKSYGIREISFYDDTFTVHHENIKKLCDLLIDNKVDLTWCCFARTDCVTFELLRKMKQAGCHQVMFGIETADEQILKNINKKIDHYKNKQAIEMAKKAGLTVRCTFMLGNPGETEESINKTIQYSIDLDPDIALFNITTPYPGTEMFNWAKENGYLITESWDEYNLSRPVMKLPTVSTDLLLNKYKETFNIFYLRPKLIFKKLRKISSFREIFTLMKGLKKIVSFTK